MDVRTGEIHQKESEEVMQKLLDDLSEVDRKHMRKMYLAPTQKQMSRKPGGLTRANT